MESAPNAAIAATPSSTLGEVRSARIGRRPLRPDYSSDVSSVGSFLHPTHAERVSQLFHLGG